MRTTRITILSLLGLLFVAYFALVGAAISGVAILQSLTDQTSINNRVTAKVTVQTFNGTIEGIDPSGLRIIIQTEMGMQSLPVANEEVIHGLAQGDQVTVKLDEQGYVLAIVKNNFAPKPAPEPRS